MTKIYACLLGNWECLNDDPNCTVCDFDKDPVTWWKESANIYAPNTRDKDLEHKFYSLDYVNLFYKGKAYRINPMFIQIVTE